MKMLRVLLLVATIIALEGQGDAQFFKRFDYNPVYTPSDAVAFWPLNEEYELDDESGNGNDATDPWGNVTLVAPANGRQCGAYEFRGNPSSYLFFPNNGAYDTSKTTKSITIMAWIYPYGNAGPIFYFDPNKTDTAVELSQVVDNMGGLSASVKFTKHNGTQVTPLTTSIPLNEWYHWTVMYNDDINNGYVYINGIEMAWSNYDPGKLATQYPAQAGAALFPQAWFNGFITCIQIYDRTLTEAEIKAAAYHPKCVCSGPKHDPHLTTLDGRDYSFQGMCWYTLVKDCSSANSQFEITTDFAPRDDTSDEIRTRAVAINVTVGDESVVVNQDNVASVSDGSLKNINIVHDGAKAILSFKLKDTTFKLLWTGKKHMFSIEFIGDYYRGKMCGLLGNADGDAKNDFQKPDGVIVKDVIEFGESWKVPGKQC
ncbi:uncharacterized protein LOC102806473 [Saccoglossus kowalevskii]|uniref:Uncharacterized protein LOC102806473 isoform X1 n=1 Tax=Saccoglossus kowalevskii TaxID=10224 RepID=A0ABM0MYL8_SACKO|nr:PREDICTED: uncharacterized protein LOC102806473 isoform X1 [Saccoglossus kowalevskii]